MATLSITWACPVNNSLSRMPATLVLIVPSGPRYSAGALGLGSYVSKCVGPPSSQYKMTDFLHLARGSPAAARERSRFGSVSPATPIDPICRKSRRDIPAQLRDVPSHQ